MWSPTLLRRAVAALVPLALLGVGLPAGAMPSRSSTRADKATPQLIEDAAKRGDLSRYRAAIEVARAVLNPERADPQYASTKLWSGTAALIKARKVYNEMPPGPERTQMSLTLAAAADPYCGGSSGVMPNQQLTTHFRIDYNASRLASGLTILDYVNALEASWDSQSTSFQWAAPPLKPSTAGRYPVRIDDLSAGLGGYVTNSGSDAGQFGDNPNTAWQESDSQATCMVLSSSMGSGSVPLTFRQKTLKTVTAHELQHSIQFGYGVLSSPNIPTDVVIESSANWMAEETLGSTGVVGAYLWPDFSLDQLGESDNSSQDVYAYWLLFRAITERFGPSGENVLQDTWEAMSQNTSTTFEAALNNSLAKPGRNISLATALQDYAIASLFNKPCTATRVLPHCYASAARYASEAQTGTPPGAMAQITSAGTSVSRAVRDMGVSWVRLPGGSSPYVVSLRNDDSGGTMRGSAVCDLGSSFRIVALAGQAGGQQTIGSSFDPSGCVAGTVHAVVTNNTALPTTAARMSTVTVSIPGATVPAQPAAPTAAAGNASATVTWSAPANGGSPITGYVVTPHRAGVPLDPIVVNTPTTSTTVKWLENGTSYTFKVRARNALGDGQDSNASGTVQPSSALPAFPISGRFVPLDQPLRILDTRDGTGLPGGNPARMAADATINLQISGRPGMPTDAEAVVMNVTATDAANEGWITVYPRGVSRPVVSNLNFKPGQTVPNLVEVPVGYAGWVSIHNSGGSQVIADVTGYVTKDSEGTSSHNGLYRALQPSRRMDTRESGGPFPANSYLKLKIAGFNGVPATGASAVVLNVTVAEPTAPGYLTVFPAFENGENTVPRASNLNFARNQTVPNRVVVRLSSDGSIGIYNSNGWTNVIVDVSGWYTDDAITHSTSTGIFHGLTPQRIADTRPGSGARYSGQTLGAGQALTVDAAGYGGVPASTSSPKPVAVLLNVTSVRTSAPSYLTVYPAGTSRPTSSDLNWEPGVTVANQVIATLDSNGRFAAWNALGSTDVIVDVAGWFS